MASSSTPRVLRSFICQSCRHPLAPSPARRAFTTTPSTRADEPTDLADPSNPSPPSAPRPPNDDALTGLANLSSSFGPQTGYSNRTSPVTSSYLDVFDQDSDDADSLLSAAHSRNYNAHKVEKPHRLHVMATKHNTHITFVQPPKSAAKTVSSSVSGTSASAADQKKMIDVLLSLSTGNIGFRKAGRGSYDAAYQ
ncbi:Ribosomal protein S11 [Teratosphaeria destructans]|uniref:Ribosomal protein S11 n=1 Tax=Teratosphaeria destructans TaxID=418781 RepID=A0A9W7SW53_9PEZI|nr:Ribosomal protein S11 [Teratosphaeria destructans]